MKQSILQRIKFDKTKFTEEKATEFMTSLGFSDFELQDRDQYFVVENSEADQSVEGRDIEGKQEGTIFSVYKSEEEVSEKESSKMDISVLPRYREYADTGEPAPGSDVPVESTETQDNQTEPENLCATCESVDVSTPVEVENAEKGKDKDKGKGKDKDKPKPAKGKKKFDEFSAWWSQSEEFAGALSDGDDGGFPPGTNEMTMAMFAAFKNCLRRKDEAGARKVVLDYAEAVIQLQRVYESFTGTASEETKTAEVVIEEKSEEKVIDAPQEAQKGDTISELELLKQQVDSLKGEIESLRKDKVVFGSKAISDSNDFSTKEKEKVKSDRELREAEERKKDQEFSLKMARNQIGL